MLTSFDGGRLFGQLYGSSPPRVLALHGWRRDHKDFQACLGPPKGDPVGAALPALALDLPGFGATPEPDGPWGSDEYATAVAAVLDDMAEPVVLIGHSFGGRVAVKLAAARPGSVAGVVLTGAPLFPASPAGRSKPPLKLRVARSLRKSGLVSEKRLEELRQQYGSEDYKVASERMRGVLVQAIREEREGAYRSALEKITSPVELVWGELDTAAPVHVAEEIASSLTAPVNLVVAQGVGHLTPLLAPGELRGALERLLGGLS